MLGNVLLGPLQEDFDAACARALAVDPQTIFDGRAALLRAGRRWLRVLCWIAASTALATFLLLVWFAAVVA